jgi:hypothetical protein
LFRFYICVIDWGYIFVSFCDLGFIRIEIWSNVKNWSDIVLIDILHRFVHTGETGKQIRCTYIRYQRGNQNRKSKNGQEKMVERTNNDLQTLHKDRATRTPLKIRD